MKTEKSKKEVQKFSLEKMNFAKLKNMHLVVGGGAVAVDENDPATGTATSKNCDKKKGGDDL
ncbi:hypothetical protein [Flavobacterium chungbukense]|uniref:Natural product n=1 Tax=Flavobacterium chungbukense TaxID=877464 RepID=A0ABP7YLW4_9FLAO|nr:hypothetical protein [Flavobacterium chungbukense]MCC4919892.1 hypothetical protein [Flavobacterium chungbukense]